MKTKLMRFITSFFESWREEKKSAGKSAGIYCGAHGYYRYTFHKPSCCGTCKERAG